MPILAKWEKPPALARRESRCCSSAAYAALHVVRFKGTLEGLAFANPLCSDLAGREHGFRERGINVVQFDTFVSSIY
jgi:hypothetical protein